MPSSSSIDILVWDDQLTDRLSSCFGGYSYAILQIDSYSLKYVKYLPKSFAAILFSIKRLAKYVCPTKYHNIDYNSRCSWKSFVFTFKRLARLLFDLSAVYYYKPRLLISYTDSAERYHYLDCVLHVYIPVLSVQNGCRHYLYQSECFNTSFSNFFFPPSFHSCFCSLSPLDSVLHKQYGWVINESHSIGSLSAGSALEEISCSVSSNKDPFIFVPLNSNLDRPASKLLSLYLKSYSISRNISLHIGVKLSRNSPRFKSYFQKAVNLYGHDSIYQFNDKRSDGLSYALNSTVVVGCYSTLLREAFALGVKILPLNFGPEALNLHFDGLQIPNFPTEHQFNHLLDTLIAESSSSYYNRTKHLHDLIGAFPFSPRPNERLSDLIADKLNY